ncbi:hypothetical protein [Massilia sp. TWP1-3-3]|uniref:hypothetical protein n=1 Tax=Massilia sp. TWP1-3-3 TaxID=2804573 RepID=UPI003CFB550D
MSKPSSQKKSPPAQPTPVQGGHANPDASQTFFLLKSGTATKIAKQADGGIGYQVLSDVERSNVYVRITFNDGGYFSRELVGVEKISQCVGHLGKSTSFATKLLRSVFVGKSTCNAGFLVALLKAEALIGPALGTETQHVVVGDFAAWQKSMLAEPGESIEVDIAPTGKSSVESVLDTANSEQPSTPKPATAKPPKADVSTT